MKYSEFLKTRYVTPSSDEEIKNFFISFCKIIRTLFWDDITTI